MSKRYIGIAVLSLAIFMLKQEVSAGVVSWWNTKYKYRKQITISTGVNAVPSGYVVKFTMDTSSLYNAGKLQAVASNERRDLRVMYWNGTSHVELYRDFILGDSNHTDETYFKLKTGITSNSSDNNYYIYYGNSSETTTPLNDLSQVYNVESGNFRRVSQATYIDANNLMQTASSGVPRYVPGKYNTGVVFEGRSNDQSSAWWNYLLRSSFEADNAGASPTGWTISGTVSVAADTGKSMHGSKAVKISPVNSNSYARQSVNSLTAGQYTLSCWVYIASYTSGSVEIRLNDVTNATWFNQSADTTKIGQWQRISVANSAATATSFTVSLEVGRTNGTAVVYYDAVLLSDFSATSLSTPFSPNYVYTEASQVLSNSDMLDYSSANLNVSACTINLWVKTAKDSGGILQVAVSPMVGPNGIIVLNQTWAPQTIGRPYVGWSGSTGVLASVMPSKKVTDGDWHMFTMTWNSSSLTGYVDAGNSETISSHVLASTYDDPFYIGYCIDYTNTNGVISDVNVFDYALSSSEVQSLYTRTTPGRMAQGAKFFVNFANNVNAYKRTTVAAEPSLSLKTEEIYTTKSSIGTQGGEIIDPADPLTKIIIPSGSLDKTSNWTFESVVLSGLTTPIKGTKQVVSVYDINVTDSSTNETIKKTNKAVTIRIHIRNIGNIIIDSSGVNTGIDVVDAKNNKKLAIGYWDGMRWIPINSTIEEIDSTNLIVSANIGHFSRYGVIVKEVGTIKTSVTPNPFTPMSSDSRFNQVTFSVENTNGEDIEVKIWDLTAGLVRIIRGSGASFVIWDGRNEYGEVVEGGVYIYQIKVGQDIAGKGTIVVAK